MPFLSLGKNKKRQQLTPPPHPPSKSDALLNRSTKEVSHGFTSSFLSPSHGINPSTASVTASVKETFTTEAQVNAVALTPDAHFLAIGTNRPYKTNFPTVTIFETASHAVRSIVTTHTFSVRGVSLSLDATFLASCDQAGQILVTDAATGAEKTRLPGHRGQVEDICLDPTASHAASAGCDATVRYWDIATAKCQFVLTGHATQVSAVSIARNAYLILSSGFDGALRGWDIRTGRQTFVLKRHNGIVTDCATDSDARVFLSCGEDKKLMVWDCRKMEVFRTFEAAKALNGCDLEPTGSRVVVSGDGGLVKAWDVNSGVALSGLEAHHVSAKIRRCAISGDGKHIVSAGSDNKSTLFWLPPVNLPSQALTTQEFTHAEVMTEIELVFCNYINDGIPLTTATVARAIEMDFKMKRVSKLSTVYVGHVCVRTLLSSGQRFSSDDTGDALRSPASFLYQRLYHKISELIKSERCQEFAERILKDAQTADILSQYDVNSILGDAKSNEYTRDLLSELTTVMNQVYKEVTSRIATVESRLENLSFDVTSLRADVDKIEAKMERDAKVQRYTNLVKFGLALIPFVGSAAMAFADGTVGLIMSLDLESMVELFTGLASTAGQAIVDAHVARVDNGREAGAEVQKEEQAVQVVQYVLSDAFLNKMQPGEREAMVRGLERQFGGNLESLRNEVRTIVEDHAELEGTDEHLRSPQMIGSASLNHGKQNGQRGSVIDDAVLVDKFRSTVGEGEHISHKRSCELLKEVVQSNVTYSGDKDVSTLVSKTLMVETNDKYYRFDEACFVRAGKTVAATLSSDEAERKCGEKFDKATVGDTEISNIVAVRMIAELSSDEELHEESIANRIKAQFGERDFLSKEEFINAARDVTGETTK